MNNYVVYCHENKIDGKKYIGITGRSPERRWSNGKGYPNNKHFSQAIRKYGWSNFEHVILYSGLTKEQAEQKEIELIAKYNTTDPHKGYNLSTGGYAHTGHKHSEKSKRLISEHSARCMLGKRMSQETKLKLSLGRRGENNPIHKHIFTDEERKAISDRMRERWSKPNAKRYGKDNPRSKEVAQYDKSGTLLNIYESTIQAEANTGVDRASIIKVCNGQRKSAGGYKWTYTKQ